MSCACLAVGKEGRDRGSSNGFGREVDCVSVCVICREGTHAVIEDKIPVIEE